MTPGLAIHADGQAEVRPVAGQLDRARMVAGQQDRLASPAMHPCPLTEHGPVARTFWQNPAGCTKVSGRVSAGSGVTGS